MNLRKAQEDPILVVRNMLSQNVINRITYMKKKHRTGRDGTNNATKGNNTYLKHRKKY
jgi:hypothetical protein